MLSAVLDENVRNPAAGNYRPMWAAAAWPRAACAWFLSWNKESFSQSSLPYAASLKVCTAFVSLSMTRGKAGDGGRKERAKQWYCAGPWRTRACVSSESSPYCASPASSFSSDCCTWDLFLQPPRYALAPHFFGWNIILLLHASILWTSPGLLFFFGFSLQHFPFWNDLNLIHVPFALCSTFSTLIKII